MDVKGEFKGIAQRNEILTQLNYGFLHRMVTLEEELVSENKRKKKKKKKEKRKEECGEEKKAERRKSWLVTFFLSRFRMCVLEAN